MEGKKLVLVLQGGGLYGVIIWGVLDWLLEEENIDFEGFLGISVGVMNVVVLVYGFYIFGWDKVKFLFDQFWCWVVELVVLFLVQFVFWDLFFGGGNMDYFLGFMVVEVVSMFVLFYQFNLMGINFLWDILVDIVDFEVLWYCKVMQLFVCVINVRWGWVKVFDLFYILVDVVMVLVCLLEVFKVVIIDGEDYWDGGFMGNFFIYFFIDVGCQDILLVQINFINIDWMFQIFLEIWDWINELSFNFSLMLEMWCIVFVDKLLLFGVDFGVFFYKVFIYYINLEVEVQGLNFFSKFNVNWQFFFWFKVIGWEKVEVWFVWYSDQVGVVLSCNIWEIFLQDYFFGGKRNCLDVWFQCSLIFFW